MSINYNLKLLLVFFVAASLATLAGPLSSGFSLPTVSLAHAYGEFSHGECPTHGSSGACSWYWFPAGPAMDTLVTPIFTDSVAEYANLQSSSPSIDFTDSRCQPSVCSTLINSPNFLVTNPISEVGYYEIQFNLANNFWGCNFNLGNSACGVQIRQGMAHMMDKTSFAANDPFTAGAAQALDNPVPTSSVGGLPAPNPCAYDASFPQSGSNCIVGAPGGTAYHINPATGADGFAWLYAPGSSDLNAAAQHFVNAGVATGFNPRTSVLTGISGAAASNPVNFFIRSDDSARLDLGNGLAAQICYLFTGSYTTPCQDLTVVRGSITAFLGFNTCGPGLDVCQTGPNLNWWMYTAAYTGPTFFDGSLYSTYNSRFVSGISSIKQPSGPCSTLSVPTSSASDYMYLCNPAYDSLSNQMEFAPCLTASGDPAIGQPNNGPGANCPNTSQLSAISAGVQAEATFGANAFTIPVFELTVQFAYLNNGWTRDINDAAVGLPNHFTWLNAYNPTSPIAGTIRQGFSETTISVNPFIARSRIDLYIVNNVYDSLYMPNPLAPSQLINWMTVSTVRLSNSSLTYTAPPHTLTTYRFTLRSDLFFQDGRPVTAYDVAFSYLSMVASGAYLGTGASPMTGIIVLNLRQFDIAVDSLGPFVLPNLTGIPIVPGRFWTNAGSSSWDSAITTCTASGGCSMSQYTLSGSSVSCDLSCTTFSAAVMSVNTADVSANYDPIAAHTFVGSGPWQCGIVTSTGSGSCSSSGTMSPLQPGGSFSLTRFGDGFAPASSISGIYFRSAGDLALYIWSQQNDQNPLLAFVSVASCYNLPVDLSGPCGHWQEGIGNPGSGTLVGVSQVSVSSRFYNLNWIAPFEWATTPPTGIGSFPPVLFEGSATLTPTPGPSSCSTPNTYYDC